MTPTSRNRVREIESWFHQHEDGEFVVVPTDLPSTVVGDRFAARTVIYTTKLPCLRHNLGAFDVAHPITMLGRCGLPVSTDLIHVNDEDFVMRSMTTGSSSHKLRVIPLRSQAPV